MSRLLFLRDLAFPAVVSGNPKFLGKKEPIFDNGSVEIGVLFQYEAASKVSQPHALEHLAMVS